MSLSYDLRNTIQRILESNVDKTEFHRLVFKKDGLIESAMISAKLIMDEAERKTELRAISDVRSYYLNIYEDMNLKKLDVTLDTSEPFGKIHILSKAIDQARRILCSYGFVEAEGPVIEDMWHNFDGLNVDEMHPARGSHDTFYLKNNDSILRTHITTVQIRHFESKPKAPFAMFTVGKTYRRDSDRTHSPVFHQLDWVLLDRDNANVAKLKGMVRSFICDFFGAQNIKIRFRPNYFPFTEPSMEVDIYCNFESNGTITFNTENGGQWLEVVGCGMIRSNIIKRYGYDMPGFAGCFGIDRLCMLKYGIGNINDMYGGLFPFLRKYSCPLADFGV